MPSPRSISRRRFAASLGTVLAASTAGCASGGDDGGAGTSTDTNTAAGGDGSPQTATPTETATPPTETEAATDWESAGELDRREANVVGVAFAESSDGRYEIDVTLDHDDAGEVGYANWWQVESLEGTRLGRRDLAHPHANQPFTRSATVEVPADVTCVVVRGHDQTHGYGGQAAVVNLDAGTDRLVIQGSEPLEFAAADCP